MSLQGVVDGVGDIQVADAARQKVMNRRLVGGIEDRRRGAAAPQCRTRQPQGRKFIGLRRKKSQILQGIKIEPGEIGCATLRPGHRQLYGDAHIRHAPLCLHRAIPEGDHGVHDGLGMDDHTNFFRRHVKKPVRLDDLQPLVHHGGGIDGYFGTHAPVGMAQRLRHGDLLHLLVRKRSKRAARTREDDLLHRFRVFSEETLKNGAVLTVDGQNRRPGIPGRCRHQTAADDQRFLVGERDAYTALHRRQGGQKAHRAHHGIDKKIVIQGRRHGGEGIASLQHSDAQPFEGLRLLRRRHTTRDGDCLRLVHGRQTQQGLHLLMRRQGDDAKTFAMLFDDAQRVDTDGAGGAD